MKFFIGTAGAAEEFIKGVNVTNIKSFGDGKLLVIYEGEAESIEVKEIIKEVEVIKEVVKEVPVEKIVEVIDPKLIEENKALKTEVKKLKTALKALE